MSEPTPDPNRAPNPAPEPHEADADVLAAYRAAGADREGDVPREQTRAAILAAAARAVQARPAAVGAADTRPQGASLRRYRAPLALAASVLIGTVAWQLASQFDDVPPAAEPAVVVADAPPPAGAPQAADAAPPLAVSVPVPPAETRSAEAPAPPARAAASDRAEATPAAGERSVAPRTMHTREAAAASAPTGATATAEAQALAQARIDAAKAAALAAQAAAKPAPAASLVAAPAADLPSVDPAGGRSEAAATETPAQRSAARTAARAAPPDSATSAEEQVRTQPVERRLYDEPATPRPLPAWLDRIAELRRAGRDAEADAELQALRRAYPQAEIPPALLRPLPTVPPRE